MIAHLNIYSFKFAEMRKKEFFSDIDKVKYS